MDKKNYITPQGFEALKAEYKQLFQIERPKLVETIAWAASNGDRSENADYIYGKRRLREIDRRLRFLNGRLETAVVVDPAQQKMNRVAFGARVTVEDEEGITTTYQIVGEDEIDVEGGKISWRSPLALALMGKQCDDEVNLRRPVGEKAFTIIEIQYR